MLISVRCALTALLAATLWLPLTGSASPEALIEAAERGDTAAVRQLLDAGTPVNGRDARGRNAVLAATQGGHVEAARLLIERGADVNAQDTIYDSAFLLAGARGHTEIVRLALAAGANLASTNRYGGTALIPACQNGHVETVRVLVQSGINLNHVNNLGWTALLETIILGNGGPAQVDIVRLLIDHGASVNLGDRQGVRPLAHAVQRGQDAIVSMLRRAGAR